MKLKSKKNCHTIFCLNEGIARYALLFWCHLQDLFICIILHEGCTNNKLSFVTSYGSVMYEYLLFPFWHLELDFRACIGTVWLLLSLLRL
jgi:hypothetical protein